MAGNAGDDPLARLLPVGNQGGFRTYGSVAKDAVKLAVLYRSGAEPDWPDALDVYTGAFTYFGDNRSPRPGAS
jgi:Restriction endonuclease AspBHI N-terminal